MTCSRWIRLLALGLIGLIALPAAGALGAAKKRKPTPIPSIASVVPLKLGVGDVLTIRGRNFVPGKDRNTVVFKRDGGRAVFVRAGRATRTTIKVRVPAKLERYFSRKTGTASATRFRVRVLARRFGRRFTSPKLSPMIGPANVPAGGGTTPARPGPGAAAPGAAAAPAAPLAPVTPAAPPPEGTVAPADCDGDGLPNATDPDDDGDLLSDALEADLLLDACRADTDGDGMEDGFEYHSAVDLNDDGGVPLDPYPGKRPYPNPLDGRDGATDYDGDGLDAIQEHRLWRYSGPHALPLSYSAGLKASAGATNDDVRDADADGLGNWDELNGRMTPQWWLAVYELEKPYTETYAATSAVDPDSDGDTRLDGADDQDFDGWTNVEELSRDVYRVHPFNPCLPDYTSATCSEHPPIENRYPPFDSSPLPPAPILTP